MKDKIFISHASADSEIVSLFVERILRAGCGVQLENIVYTSWEDTGVVNGEDIPSAIKDGIRNSSLFFMMVSENYRESEVCLNEMGAAWMDDSLVRMIVLLPGVGFDRIGWLMKLKKGTSITDDQGLDAIHDRVCEIFSLKPKTSTWNRSRADFIAELSKLAPENEPVQATPECYENEEMDILDYRESFNLRTQEYSNILLELTEATNHYNERVGEEAARMNVLQQTPAAITPVRVREIMVSIARETDILSEVYKRNTPLLQQHFDASISSAIALQLSGIQNDDAIQENREAFWGMVTTMKETRLSLTEMRDSMDGIPDLDKSFRKSKKRLQAALGEMLKVVDFCIKRANEIQVV